MVRSEAGHLHQATGEYSPSLANKQEGGVPIVKSTSRGPFIGFTLETSTWVSNSNGLYDYESHNVSAKTYRCHGRNNLYRILRKGVDVSLVTDALGQELLSSDPEVRTIAKLTALEEGGYQIEASSVEEDRCVRALLTGVNPEEPADPEEEALLNEESRFWIVIRSLKNGSIPLRDGDTIKLGRVAFLVKQVVLNADEEHKVNDRNANDEDDVATCETRRSDTLVQHTSTTYVPPAAGPSRPAHVAENQNSYNSSRQTDYAGDICLFNPVERSRDSEEHRAPPLEAISCSEESHDACCSDGPPSRNFVLQNSLVNGAAADISLVPRIVSDDAVAHLTLTSQTLTSKASTTGGPVCRICLSEEEDPKNDPLVSPCKCKGSMKWIHLKCLRTWMEGRLNIKSVLKSRLACFFWRLLECELCQEPYPTYVDVSRPRRLNSRRHPNLPDSNSSVLAVHINPIHRALWSTQMPEDANMVELFRIPKPAVPFVILESKHQPSGNIGFHFLSLNTRDSVRLGRGHEADVRVADISVSRLHATLRYQSCPEALLNALRDYPTQQIGSIHDWHKNSNITHASITLRNPLGYLENPLEVQKPYVYIEDLKSKFGTLVAIDKPIFLYPRMMLSLQVGRTVLTLYVRKPTWSRFIPSCFHIYYQGIFSKYRRRQHGARKPSLTARIATHRDNDAHDVRLLETYLPMSLLAGHVNNPGMDHENEGTLAMTQPLERALAPI